MSKNQVSKVKAIAGAIAASTAIFAGSAFAGVTPSIFNIDNPLGGTFTNFDWAANGTAFTTGFVPVAGSTFSITYFAANGAFQGGTAVSTNMKNDPSVPQAGKLYEYTIVATLQETVVGCSGTTCTFAINGGNFNVYYDNNPLTFASNAGGTGFGDGLLQISANILPSTTNQTFDTSTGFNVTGIKADITYTDTNPADPSHISPKLTASTTVTTLQIGGFVTAAPATGYNGVAFTGPSNCGGVACGQIVFQADGNSAFVVPEPGSLALFGVGVAALGLRYRRRKAA